MKDKIEQEIELVIRNFEKIPGISTRWKKPVIAYASAQDPLFLKLPEVTVAEHLQPTDINPQGKSVVTYFLPFEDWIVKSNQIAQESSYEWARAYVETNKLIQTINDHLINYLGELGFITVKLPNELSMDHERLVSVWSNRHVSYVAGLGTFGINNMLITESGCCGRLGNVVTNLELEPTQRPKVEYCLYKVDKSCGICVNNCEVDALGDKEFDRFGCNEVLKNNAERFKDLGRASCCGKCLVGLPCSSTNPINKKVDNNPLNYDIRVNN